MTSEADPPWPREAARAIAHELVGWLRALGAVTRAPRRFVAAWAAGETRPLNPLAFSLNVLAVAGPVTAALVHLTGVEDDVLPLWAQICKPLFPWVYNLLWVTPVHLLLRALGGRARLRTTVGAFFYANGPIHLVRIFVVPLQVRQMAHPHDWTLALESAGAGLVTMILFTIYLSAAMSGAHRIRAWRAAVAVVFVFGVSVIVWGWIGIHTGGAGLRWVRALIT